MSNKEPRNVEGGVQVVLTPQCSVGGGDGDGAGGADVGAGAAADAGGGDVEEGRGNALLGTAVGAADGVAADDFGADADALTAQDAPGQMIGTDLRLAPLDAFVQERQQRIAGIGLEFHTLLARQFDQLRRLGSTGQQQGEDEPPRLDDPRRVGLDDHAVLDGRGAGRQEEVPAGGRGDFDMAQAASAGRFEFFVVAQVRDVDAGPQGGIEHGRTRPHRDRRPVHGQRNVFHGIFT